MRPFSTKIIASNSCKEEKLKKLFWTIQDRAALPELLSRGFLTGREHRIPFCYMDDEQTEMFVDAYQWLRKQMKARIPGYGGGFPVWFWPKRPDLRCGGRAAPGTKLLLFEVLLDEESVLYSDFDGWHAVLNRSYLGLTEEACEGTFTANEVVRSWQTIFDLEAMAASEYWCDGRQQIQVVAESFNLAQLRSVTEFTAR